MEDGSHPLARPAPGSPEIQNDRDFIERNIFFEIGANELDGSGYEQFVFAPAAFGVISQADALQAIGAATMGANNLYLFLHDLLLILYYRTTNLGLSRRGEDYRMIKREEKEKDGCDITIQIRVKRARPTCPAENLLGRIGRL
jgi:hypothetical protein